MDDTPNPTEQEPSTDEADKRRDAYIGWAIIGVILAVTLIAFTTVGFGPYEEIVTGARAPTLWDWLQLLIVPAVLALGALWFNKTQKDRELFLADLAILEEQTIAKDQQRQTTLEAYYDRMTELLLTHHLREVDEDSEVRSIAKARTVAVVRSLDVERNRQLFAFLAASKLIGVGYSIIDFSEVEMSAVDLSGANLSGIILKEADLSRAKLTRTTLAQADLTWANLNRANLNQSNLSQAALMWAKMIEANLSGADMYRANLRGAELDAANLTQANLSGATLEWAKLPHADLSKVNTTNVRSTYVNFSKANLRSANLQEANISLANLTEADLRGTNLSRAILSRARLEQTNLCGANLREAYLRESNLYDARYWTIEQLELAKTLEGAIMPDEIQLRLEKTEYQEQIEGPTFEEWKAQYLVKHGGSATDERNTKWDR